MNTDTLYIINAKLRDALLNYMHRTRPMVEVEGMVLALRQLPEMQRFLNQDRAEALLQQQQLQPTPENLKDADPA